MRGDNCTVAVSAAEPEEWRFTETPYDSSALFGIIDTTLQATLRILFDRPVEHRLALNTFINR
jgi:hypothetical protein